MATLKWKTWIMCSIYISSPDGVPEDYVDDLEAVDDDLWPVLHVDGDGSGQVGDL